MQVDQIAHKFVSGLVAIRHPAQTAIDDSSFSNAIDALLERRRVEPYLFPQGKLDRIPWSGFSRYFIFNAEKLRRPFFIEPSQVDDELLQYLNDIPKGNIKQSDDLVFVIDGEGYSTETIQAMPDVDNVFVMFSPYRALRTSPVLEAKRYVGRESGISLSSPSGIERVPYKS